MEWRQQTSLSCADAFSEAQRWIEEVTGKTFDCSDFRAALENGVLLCDLINQLKPGIIKRVNRLSTPIAGLDNVSVFLKACGKLGLNESQLFHPGDLQDLSTRVTLKRDESSRRLKNVLITIYWLGRKANQDLLYKGPQLNFKSFEGLLGLALSRALDDASNCCYYQEKDEIQRKRPSYKRQSSVDSVESLDAKATTTNSEGCGSDAEAEQVFKMETTHTSTQPNKGYSPPLLQKAKQARGEHGKVCTSPLSRSKSLSDIPMVYPVRKIPDENNILDETQETGTRHEFKRKSSATKDAEAQWQDDLTKWKSRRRSSKSEVHRKSLDREHVMNQMTNGAVTITKSGPIKRDQPSQNSHNLASHPYSTSPTKSSRSNLRPHTRALLARSYATETPFNSPTSYSPQTSLHAQGTLVGAMPASDTNILGKENHMATLASVGAAATTPSMENPFSSQTHIKNSTGPSMAGVSLTSHGSSVLPKEITKLNVATEALTLVNHTAVNTTDDMSNQKSPKENQDSPVESNRGPVPDKYLCRAGTWSGSASLPRGYRRSEGSNRLSVITARPFGTKLSRVSSLPRLCNVDDNQLNWMSNDDKEELVSPPVTSLLKRQTAAAHLKANPPTMQTEHRAEPEKENCAVHSSVIQSNGYHHQPQLQNLSQAQLCTAQVSQHNSSSSLLKEPSVPINEDHSYRRVCFTLKPNSRPDFGFQTDWDNKRARVKSIQPGTPAEVLCVNDEIIAVDGVAVTQMNYSQWKNKMTSALQTGSLIMDVRRYGNRGGSESAISDLQVPSLSPSSSSWSWDHEEERRRQEKWQEEQERLLQEKYQRDQERLEAEWRKAQQDASSDMGKKDELKPDATKMMSCDVSQQRLELHVNGVTNKTQDEAISATNEVKGKENAPSEAKETQNEKSNEDWAKSLSTPALASPQKQMRGAGDQRKRKSQTVSKAEQERQQILDEMKKRTQLLTDNSWIRQRSASFYKEPVMPGVPIKRYESMDSLESWRHSPVAAMTFTYPRPQSAAAGYCGSTRISSPRHSTGSMPPPRSTAGRMEPGRRTCCVCEGVVDSGAAMVIEALSLCFHLACFQCMGCYRDLRGTETGVQVRIQNHRPYCEPCYFQLKCFGAAAM